MKIMDLVGFLKTNYPYKYYANGFPAESKVDCAAVKLTGGTVDPSIPRIKKISFQVLIRTHKQSAGETLALDIFEGLNGAEFFDVGETWVAFCLADQAIPIFIGKDENSNSIYSLNFTCKVKD